MSPSAEGANIAGWTGLATTQVIGNTNCLRTDGNVDSPCLEIVRVLNCDKCKLLTIDYENCKSEWAFNKMTVQLDCSADEANTVLELNPVKSVTDSHNTGIETEHFIPQQGACRTSNLEFIRNIPYFADPDLIQGYDAFVNVDGLASGFQFSIVDSTVKIGIGKSTAGVDSIVQQGDFIPLSPGKIMGYKIIYHPWDNPSLQYEDTFYGLQFITDECYPKSDFSMVLSLGQTKTSPDGLYKHTTFELYKAQCQDRSMDMKLVADAATLPAVLNAAKTLTVTAAPDQAIGDYLISIDHGMGIQTVTVKVVACGPDLSLNPLQVQQGFSAEAKVIAQADAATYEAECIDHQPYIFHSKTTPSGVVPTWLTFDGYTVKANPPSSVTLSVYNYYLTLSYGEPPIENVFNVEVNLGEICVTKNNWEDGNMAASYVVAAASTASFDIETALPLDNNSPQVSWSVTCGYATVTYEFTPASASAVPFHTVVPPDVAVDPAGKYSVTLAPTAADVGDYIMKITRQNDNTVIPQERVVSIKVVDCTSRVADGAELSYYVGSIPSLFPNPLYQSDLSTYTSECVANGFSFTLTSGPDYTVTPAEGDPYQVAWVSINANFELDVEIAGIAAGSYPVVISDGTRSYTIMVYIRTCLPNTSFAPVYMSTGETRVENLYYNLADYTANCAADYAYTNAATSPTWSNINAAVLTLSPGLTAEFAGTFTVTLTYGPDSPPQSTEITVVVRHCTPKIAPYFDSGMIVSTGETKLSDGLYHQTTRDLYDAECVNIGNGMSTSRLLPAGATPVPAWVTIDTAEYKIKVTAADVATSAGSYDIKIVYDEAGLLFQTVTIHVYQCTPLVTAAPFVMTTGDTKTLALCKETVDCATKCAGYPWVLTGEPTGIRTLDANKNIVFTVPDGNVYAGQSYPFTISMTLEGIDDQLQFIQTLEITNCEPNLGNFVGAFAIGQSIDVVMFNQANINDYTSQCVNYAKEFIIADNPYTTWANMLPKTDPLRPFQMHIVDVPAVAYDNTPNPLSVAYGAETSILNLNVVDCRTASFSFPGTMAFGQTTTIDLFRKESDSVPPKVVHADAASYTTDCAMSTHKMTVEVVPAVAWIFINANWQIEVNVPADDESIDGQTFTTNFMWAGNPSMQYTQSFVVQGCAPVFTDETNWLYTVSTGESKSAKLYTQATVADYLTPCANYPYKLSPEATTSTIYSIDETTWELTVSVGPDAAYAGIKAIVIYYGTKSQVIWVRIINCNPNVPAVITTRTGGSVNMVLYYQYNVAEYQSVCDADYRVKEASTFPLEASIGTYVPETYALSITIPQDGTYPTPFTNPFTAIELPFKFAVPEISKVISLQVYDCTVNKASYKSQTACTGEVLSLKLFQQDTVEEYQAGCSDVLFKEVMATADGVETKITPDWVQILAAYTMQITVPINEATTDDPAVPPLSINIINSDPATPDLMLLSVVNCIPGYATQPYLMAQEGATQSLVLFQDAATGADYKVVCANYPFTIIPVPVGDPVAIPAFVEIDADTGNLVIGKDIAAETPVPLVAGIYPLRIQAGSCTTCFMDFQLQIFDCTPKYPDGVVQSLNYEETYSQSMIIQTTQAYNDACQTQDTNVLNIECAGTTDDPVPKLNPDWTWINFDSDYKLTATPPKGITPASYKFKLCYGAGNLISVSIEFLVVSCYPNIVDAAYVVGQTDSIQLYQQFTLADYRANCAGNEFALVSLLPETSTGDMFFSMITADADPDVDAADSFILKVNIPDNPLNAGVYTGTISAGSLGVTTVTITVTSCAPKTGTYTVSLGEVMKPAVLYPQTSYNAYISDCPLNTMVRTSVTPAAEWIVIDSEFQLRVSPPDDFIHVGTYTLAVDYKVPGFSISVTVVVIACTPKVTGFPVTRSTGEGSQNSNAYSVALFQQPEGTVYTTTCAQYKMTAVSVPAADSFISLVDGVITVNVPNICPVEGCQNYVVTLVITNDFGTPIPVPLDPAKPEEVDPTDDYVWESATKLSITIVDCYPNTAAWVEGADAPLTTIGQVNVGTEGAYKLFSDSFGTVGEYQIACANYLMNLVGQPAQPDGVAEWINIQKTTAPTIYFLEVIPPQDVVFAAPEQRFANYPLTIQYGADVKNQVSVAVDVLDCRPDLSLFPMDVTSGSQKTAVIYKTQANFYPTATNGFNEAGDPVDYTTDCAKVLFQFEFVPTDAAWGSFITFPNYEIDVVMPVETTDIHLGLKEVKITYGLYSDVVQITGTNCEPQVQADPMIISYGEVKSFSILKDTTTIADYAKCPPSPFSIKADALRGATEWATLDVNYTLSIDLQTTNLPAVPNHGIYPIEVQYGGQDGTDPIVTVVIQVILVNCYPVSFKTVVSTGQIVSTPIYSTATGTGYGTVQEYMAACVPTYELRFEAAAETNWLSIDKTPVNNDDPDNPVYPTYNLIANVPHESTLDAEFPAIEIFYGSGIDNKRDGSIRVVNCHPNTVATVDEADDPLNFPMVVSTQETKTAKLFRQAALSTYKESCNAFTSPYVSPGYMLTFDPAADVVPPLPEGYQGMISMGDQDYHLAVTAPDDASVAAEYSLTLGYGAEKEPDVKVTVLDCSPKKPAVPFVTLSIGEALSMESDVIFNQVVADGTPQQAFELYTATCQDYLFLISADSVQLIDPVVLNTLTYSFTIPGIGTAQPIGDYTIKVSHLHAQMTTPPLRDFIIKVIDCRPIVNMVIGDAKVNEALADIHMLLDEHKTWTANPLFNTAAYPDDAAAVPPIVGLETYKAACAGKEFAVTVFNAIDVTKSTPLVDELAWIQVTEKGELSIQVPYELVIVKYTIVVTATGTTLTQDITLTIVDCLPQNPGPIKVSVGQSYISSSVQKFTDNAAGRLEYEALCSADIRPVYVRNTELPDPDWITYNEAEYKFYISPPADAAKVTYTLALEYGRDVPRKSMDVMLTILRCGVNEIDPAAVWNIDEDPYTYNLVIDDAADCGDFPLSLVEGQSSAAWTALEGSALTINPMEENGAVIGEYKISITYGSILAPTLTSTITITLQNCGSRHKTIPRTAPASETWTYALYHQESYATMDIYRAACAGKLLSVSVDLAGNEWMTWNTDTWEITVAPYNTKDMSPTTINIVAVSSNGEPTNIADRSVTITPDPQCWKNNLWLATDNLAAYTVNEKKEVKFNVPRTLTGGTDGVSWSEVCGLATVTIYYTDGSAAGPQFITLIDQTSMDETVLIAPQIGDAGQYTLTVQQSSEHGNKGKSFFELYVVESPCNAKVSGLTATGYPGDSLRNPLNRFDTLALFTDACDMLQVRDCPNFVYVDGATLEMVVEMPKTVAAVGQYTCTLTPGNPTISIDIQPPCTSDYMSGLDDDGILTMRLDEVRELELKLDDDDNGVNWSEVCGTIVWTELIDEPVFVTYDEALGKIFVRPIEESHLGLHYMGFKQKRGDHIYFSSINILVLSLAQASPDMMPYFEPALENQAKQIGVNWLYILPTMVDPMKNYAFISQVIIEPQSARLFLKDEASSTHVDHDGHIFWIAFDDYNELAINVTITVELAAFNGDYVKYKALTPTQRNSPWRWRKSRSTFNLTITGKDQIVPTTSLVNIFDKSPAQVCTEQNLLAQISAKNQPKLLWSEFFRQPCDVQFDKKVEINMLGKVKIHMVDEFNAGIQFRDAFNTRQEEIKAMISVRVIKKPEDVWSFLTDAEQVEWEVARDAAREGTTGSRRLQAVPQEKQETEIKEYHNMPEKQLTWQPILYNVQEKTLELDVLFDYPWEVSGDSADLIQIMVCGMKGEQLFEDDYQKILDTKLINRGCLEIKQTIPRQIYGWEKTACLCFKVVMMCFALILLAKHVQKTSTQLYTSALLTQFSVLFMATHMFTVDVDMPGAAKLFNSYLVEVLTFDILQVKYTFYGGLDEGALPLSYDAAGYLSTSLLKNMGSVFLYMLLLPIVHTTALLVSLSLSRSQSKYRVFRSVRFNTGRKTYVNFLVGNQMVMLTSALVYFRYTKSYYESVLDSVEMLVALAILIANVLLVASIFCAMYLKGWSGLDKELKTARERYPEEHTLLMITSKSQDENTAREAFDKLEEKYDEIEVRFKEMTQVFGAQCAELDPEYHGFTRSIMHIAMEFGRPLVLVLMIVFIDHGFTKIFLILLFNSLYYMAQFHYVKALDRTNSYWSAADFFLLITVFYAQVNLQHHGNTPRFHNLSGWAYNFALWIMVLARLGVNSMAYLQEMNKRGKEMWMQILPKPPVEKKRNQKKPRKLSVDLKKQEPRMEPPTSSLKTQSINMKHLEVMSQEAAASLEMQQSQEEEQKTEKSVENRNQSQLSSSTNPSQQQFHKRKPSKIQQNKRPLQQQQMQFEQTYQDQLHHVQQMQTHSPRTASPPQADLPMHLQQPQQVAQTQYNQNFRAQNNSNQWEREQQLRQSHGNFASEELNEPAPHKSKTVMDFNPIKKDLNTGKKEFNSGEIGHVVKRVGPKFLTQQDDRQAPIPKKSGLVHLQRKQNNRDLSKVNRKIYQPSNSSSKEQKESTNQEGYYEGGEEEPIKHFKSVQEPPRPRHFKSTQSSQPESITSNSKPAQPKPDNDPESMPTEEASEEMFHHRLEGQLPTIEVNSEYKQTNDLEQQEAYQTVSALVNPLTEAEESEYDTRSYSQAQSYIQKSQGPASSNKTINEFMKLQAKKAQNDKKQQKVLDQLKSLQDIESSINFITGIEARGYQIADNSGQGDCMFLSLALMVWGNSGHHGIMREWIVKRMRKYPRLYNVFDSLKSFNRHCDQMEDVGCPGTFLELQVASDFFFTFIEVYTVADFHLPHTTLRPRRLFHYKQRDCKNRIFLWFRHRSHCLALLYSEKWRTDNIQEKTLQTTVVEEKNYSVKAWDSMAEQPWGTQPEEENMDSQSASDMASSYQRLSARNRRNKVANVKQEQKPGTTNLVQRSDGKVAGGAKNDRQNRIRISNRIEEMLVEEEVEAGSSDDRDTLHQQSANMSLNLPIHLNSTSKKFATIDDPTTGVDTHMKLLDNNRQNHTSEAFHSKPGMLENQQNMVKTTTKFSGRPPLPSSGIKERPESKSRYTQYNKADDLADPGQDKVANMSEVQNIPNMTVSKPNPNRNLQTGPGVTFGRTITNMTSLQQQMQQPSPSKIPPSTTLPDVAYQQKDTTESSTSPRKYQQQQTVTTIESGTSPIRFPQNNAKQEQQQRKPTTEKSTSPPKFTQNGTQQHKATTDNSTSLQRYQNTNLTNQRRPPLTGSSLSPPKFVNNPAMKTISNNFKHDRMNAVSDLDSDYYNRSNKQNTFGRMQQPQRQTEPSVMSNSMYNPNEVTSIRSTSNFNKTKFGNDSSIMQHRPTQDERDALQATRAKMSRPDQNEPSQPQFVRVPQAASRQNTNTNYGYGSRLEDIQEKGRFNNSQSPERVGRRAPHDEDPEKTPQQYRDIIYAANNYVRNKQEQTRQNDMDRKSAHMQEHVFGRHNQTGPRVDFPIDSISPFKAERGAMHREMHPEKVRTNKLVSKAKRFI